MSPEPGEKCVQLLKEVVPQLTKVGVLLHPATGTSILRTTEAATRRSGLKLAVVQVQSADGLESAFSALMRQSPGALSVLPDTMLYDHRRRVCDLATKNRLPAIAQQKENAEAGCLMAYGSNIADLYRRAAGYVDRILRGAKPADLPVEQPTKFELIINMRTAKVLGLTVPQSLLLRADQVIE